MLRYRHIYLSPHLDDAVLSCGGRIHQLVQAGEPVLVVTIFAGSPSLGDEAKDETPDYIAALHQRWQAETDAPTLRRAEDEAALRILEADFYHMSYLDCIYRQHPVTGDFLYRSDGDIFAQVHPVEFSLAVELRRVGARLLTASGPATIYAPLTAGHHVDHQIVAAAALGLQVAGHRVAFYEDYPYAEDPSALTAARQWIGGENWQAELFPLSSQDLVTKTEAVLCYRSQLSTFFDDDAQAAQRLQAYALKVGQGATPHRGPGEQIWYLTK